MHVLALIGQGLANAGQMAWEVGWALVLGFLLSAIVLSAVVWVGLRLLVSRRLEEEARRHAQAADTGHQHESAVSEGGWRERLTSASAWSDVAHNFRGDLRMLWKELTIGFLIAG